jgi:hypothetical protein
MRNFNRIYKISRIKAGSSLYKEYPVLRLEKHKSILAMRNFNRIYKISRIETGWSLYKRFKILKAMTY